VFLSNETVWIFMSVIFLKILMFMQATPAEAQAKCASLGMTLYTPTCVSELDELREQTQNGTGMKLKREFK
jgi:hypothetical protein